MANSTLTMAKNPEDLTDEDIKALIKAIREKRK